MWYLINIYSLFAGYVLYLGNEVDRAVAFFQRCALVSLSQQKAAALIMLGCCCAIKVLNLMKAKVYMINSHNIKYHK